MESLSGPCGNATVRGMAWVHIPEKPNGFSDLPVEFSRFHSNRIHITLLELSLNKIQRIKLIQEFSSIKNNPRPPAKKAMKILFPRIFWVARQGYIGSRDLLQQKTRQALRHNPNMQSVDWLSKGFSISYHNGNRTRILFVAVVATQRSGRF